MKCDRMAGYEFISTSATQAGAIAAIHGGVFARPWSESEVRALLSGGSVAGFTALRDREPIGFLIFRRFASEAEVLSVAVLPGERRQGAARALMIRLERHLLRHACHTLFLEVDATNIAARALYTSLAFEQVGIRRRYYRHLNGRRGDAVVMRKRLRLDLVAQAGDYERQDDEASSTA